MDYQIPIPSYNRIETLRKATLATLERHDTDPRRVTIFVANDEQYKEYREAIDRKYEIVVAELGLLNAKRFYHNYYDSGTKLFNVLDDVYSLKQKDGEKMADYSGTIDELVSLGFRASEKVGAKMWGINPVTNGFFMKDQITIGLRLIYGTIYGDYAGNPSVLGKRVMESPSGEDWENSISSFIANGSLVRIEWIAPVSKLFAKGGMSDELKLRGTDRKTEHELHLRAIAAAYPDLCSIYYKAGDVINLRLKNITHARIPKGTI
jgi:hypothetical protein